MSKIAVVLFNLGGPDSLEAVQPFLFNLFNDKAIIRAPTPIRYFLAKFISKKRAPYTQEIYKKIGNQSPLLEWSKKQVEALENKLNQATNHQSPITNHYKTFIAMRYWHPFSPEVVRQVKEYAPDQIILLPLYPQFSTSTTESSIEDWQREAKKQGLNVPTRPVCCYPTEPHFIHAHLSLLEETLANIPGEQPVRILFSAHGLPEKIIAAGDPYQWQVEQTVAAIMDKFPPARKVEHRICYQSRVGPLKWIGPSTEDEIKRAGQDGKTIVLVPVAFVSEHSETLVELDIDYAKLAASHGVNGYHRVPALGVSPHYIECLQSLCETVASGEMKQTPYCPQGKACPDEFSECPCRT